MAAATAQAPAPVRSPRTALLVPHRTALGPRRSGLLPAWLRAAPTTVLCFRLRPPPMHTTATLPNRVALYRRVSCHPPSTIAKHERSVWKHGRLRRAQVCHDMYQQAASNHTPPHTTTTPTSTIQTAASGHNQPRLQLSTIVTTIPTARPAIAPTLPTAVNRLRQRAPTVGTNTVSNNTTTSATTSAKPAPATSCAHTRSRRKSPCEIRHAAVVSYGLDGRSSLRAEQRQRVRPTNRVRVQRQQVSQQRQPLPTKPSFAATHHPPGRTADRTTVYDDNYEEPVYSNTVDEMFRASSPASATRGDESVDVSFTIVRATVFEPVLPKAKCADCGDSLDFEELANHTCQPASASKLPLLTIQVPPSSSSSAVSSTATSPAIATPRSPFFDRYDHLISQSGPASPALLGCPANRRGQAARRGDAHRPRRQDPRNARRSQGVEHTNVAGGASQGRQITTRPAAADAALGERHGCRRRRSRTQKDDRATEGGQEEGHHGETPCREQPPPRACTSPRLRLRKRRVRLRGRCRREWAHANGATSRLSASEAQHAKKESSSSISSTATDSSGVSERTSARPRARPTSRRVRATNASSRTRRRPSRCAIVHPWI